MDQTVPNFLSKTTLYEISDILSKPFSKRTATENDQIITVLSNLGYFHRYIADPTERADFILAMSKHLKYKHYPRGAGVCHPNDPESDFGIIIQGHALLYDHKTQEKFDKDSEDVEKSHKFHHFRKMMEEKEFSRKSRKCQFLRGNSYSPESASSNKLFLAKSNKFTQSYESAIDVFINTVNELLGSAKSQDEAQEQGELTIEEKLLLLHHDGSIKNYFTDGIATYEKVKELKDGDTITELSLLTGMSVQHPIIALEDLHILSITHMDFFSLFQAKIGNLAEKKRFLWSLFPELLIAMVVKLAAAISERTFVNRDVVYEQGEEAGAIYILKTGGIQLITYEEGEKVEKIPYSTHLTDGPKKNNTGKQKLIIGEISAGSIFGEDEVINNSPRKYTAICSKSPTLLYVLKKEVYHDILEKHFPLIAQAYKYGMKTKFDWRQDRIKKGIKIMNELADGPPRQVTTKIIIKTPRLQNADESSSRNLGLKRSELVYDTQTATVMNLEERNSRNTKSTVKITTCGLDQFAHPQLKRFFEPEKPEKVEKTPEKPMRKKAVKRSQSIFDKKPSSPRSKLEKNSGSKSKIKLPDKDINIDDLSTDVPFQYRLSTPAKFHQHDFSTSTPVMSPTSAKTRGQPQTPLAQPRVLTLRKGSLMLNQLFSAGNSDNMKNVEPLNVPSSARILYAGSPMIGNLVQSHGREPSPVSPAMSPKAATRHGRTFSDALNINDNLSPKSTRFYQRIVSARPKFKKEGPDSVIVNDPGPLDIKGISRAHVPEGHDPMIPRLSIMSQRGSLTTTSPRAAPSHNIFNSARNSPASPKAVNVATKNQFEFEAPVVAPKKVFLLNRGESEPKIILVDHDSVKGRKSKKTNRLMM